MKTRVAFSTAKTQQNYFRNGNGGAFYVFFGQVLAKHIVLFVTTAVDELSSVCSLLVILKRGLMGLRTFGRAQCTFGKPGLDLARFTVAMQRVQEICVLGL